MLFVSACAIALSTVGAFAQNQPAPGASSEGNVGPGTNMQRSSTHMKKGTTTGMSGSRTGSSMANPSSEGNVGPGTNNNATNPGTNNNATKQPAGR